MWTILLPAILATIVFCLYIKHSTDKRIGSVTHGLSKKDLKKIN